MTRKNHGDTAFYDELSDEESPGISAWRIPDLIFALILLPGSLFFGGYLLYAASVLVSFVVFWLLVAMKDLYRRDIPRSNAFKHITALIRTLAYIACIIMLVMPFTMDLALKWYYPVQKAYYGVNEDIEAFLPESIPKNARDYNVRFCRSGFPGASCIEISFFTDQGTISEYRDKAIAAGAETSPENGRFVTSILSYELSKAGVSSDEAEIYYYPGSSEHFPKYYILDEKTGYVKIYY